jgi:hypothetical protein
LYASVGMQLANQCAGCGACGCSSRTGIARADLVKEAQSETLDAFGNTVNATASVGDVGNGISSANNVQTLVRVGIRQTF